MRNQASWLSRIAPDFSWLRNYQLHWLVSDIAAGLTLGAVMIPVALAFGDLAGLPLAGLYAALFPLLAYVLFGSSRQLIIGPDATMAAVVATSVAPLAGGDAERFVLLVAGLGLLIGLFCVLGSLLRLGFISDFLAKPVIVGFMQGLAFIIFVGQLPKVLGFKVSGDTPLLQAGEILRHIGQTRPLELAIGAFCVTSILGFKRWFPKIPGQIVALLGSLAVAHFMGLEQQGVAVIGNIPQGLPSFHWPQVSWNDWWTLTPIAFGAMLVGFSDTVVTARGFASRNRYRIDANRELMALGMGNIASALTQGLPIAGSGSRTAVAESVGSRSKATSLFAALAVAVVMLFFTPYLRELPQAALGGILVTASWNLSDFREFGRLWRFRGIGFFAAILVFVGVIGIGVMEGIGIGVVSTLLMLIKTVAFPQDAVLGRVDGSFRDIVRRTRAETIPGVLIYRFNAPLFFANCSHFRSRIETLIENGDPPIRLVVVNAAMILAVDLAACEMLVELIDELHSRGIQFRLADVRDLVKEYLDRGGVTDKLGPQGYFSNIEGAVQSN